MSFAAIGLHFMRRDFRDADADIIIIAPMRYFGDYRRQFHRMMRS